MAAGVPELLRESENEARQLLRLLEEDRAELPQCVSGELLEACLTGSRQASQTAGLLLERIRELENGL